MDKLLIGSHVSMASPRYYLGSVEEAILYGSTTFMFYTGTPQNAFRSPLEKLKIEEGRALIREHGFDEDKIVVHAPYIINIANQLNKNNYEVAKSVLLNEVKRTAGFGCKILVLHPGSHVNTGVENGIDSIVKALNWVLSQDGTDVKIALETMAGKGAEMGTSFEQMQEIISKTDYPERIGICLDTCHISDNNYDINDFDAILDNVENTVGLNKLLVVHVNDSKNPMGSHKDRHENLGYGEIGFEALNAVVHNPRIEDVPKILETPYVDDKPPYKIEIEMLRNSEFKDWKETSNFEENWKETGKELGSSFKQFGKTFLKSARTVVDKADDKCNEEKDKSVDVKGDAEPNVFNDGTWRETGKDLGHAFASLGKSIGNTFTGKRNK